MFVDGRTCASTLNANAQKNLSGFATSMAAARRYWDPARHYACRDKDNRPTDISSARRIERTRELLAAIVETCSLERSKQ
jgi:hypothetical protein